MLLNPKTPLIFGTLSILGLTVYLTFENPAPGKYSRAHARIAGIDFRSLGMRQMPSFRRPGAPP